MVVIFYRLFIILFFRINLGIVVEVKGALFFLIVLVNFFVGIVMDLGCLLF